MTIILRFQCDILEKYWHLKGGKNIVMLTMLSTWLNNFLLFNAKDKWMSLSVCQIMHALPAQAPPVAPDEAMMRNASVVFMLV